MLKKLFFILLFLSIISVGLAYYFFNQATQVPEWYETQEKNSKPKINVQDLSNVRSAQAAITNKIEQQVKSQNNTYQKENVNIRLNQQELNQLVLVAIAENYQQRQLLEAAETIQTKIQKNALEIGAIINPSKIANTNLQDNQKTALDKVIQTFPQLNNQDVYIGIEGQPKIKNGKVVFEQNSRIKVGNLSFTVAEIAKKLGLPPEKITQIFELKTNQFNIRDIQLNKDEILLKVSQ